MSLLLNYATFECGLELNYSLRINPVLYYSLEIYNRSCETWSVSTTYTQIVMNTLSGMELPLLGWRQLKSE